MSRVVRRPIARKTTARGFTLVELMVSMVLGLVVIGAVVSVLLANKRTFNTTSAMSQVQESARTAFELLARDLRQTGVTGCDSSGRVANVLNTTTPATWWGSWVGVTGFDGTAVDTAVSIGTNPGERVTGTDSLQVQGIVGNGLSVASHDVPGAKLTINATSTDLVTGDVLVVCDFDHASIFQVSSYDATNKRVAYTTGTGTTGNPRNCSTGLGFPTDCTIANVYSFAKNSHIARLSVVDWYIGNNGRTTEGGRSLYRKRLDNGGVVQTEEIVAGITNLAIQYRVDGTDDFVDASSVTAANWPKVNAVSLTLTMDSADQRVSSDLNVNSGRLERSFTWVVTLRNRVP